MRPRRLLKRIAAAQHNVRFSDAIALARALGVPPCSKRREAITIHPEVREPLNLQNARGQAKPYQLKQLVQLVERYNLQLEEEA